MRQPAAAGSELASDESVERRKLMASRALVTILMTGLFAAVAGAQPPGPAGPAGTRVYDPGTVETANGVVKRIEIAQSKGPGGGAGVHLILATDTGEIAVHLGPRRYVDEQKLKLAVDDRIEVRGSRVSIDGKSALIAAEVKKGEQVMRLRNADGTPLWRGSGRRRK
jgi:hypothetical protein